MSTERREALQVVETVAMAGRIFEDARNHVWYVPTNHPIFSALAMVAGPVSRQIEAGLLTTGIEGNRRFAEISSQGEAFLAEVTDATGGHSNDEWLAQLLLDTEGLPA